MKKIALTLLALVLAAGTMNAQLKPEAGSIGLGFNITGIANVGFFNWSNTGLSGQALVDPAGTGLLPTTVDGLVPQQMMFGRYYIASDLAVRVGLGINSVSMNTTTEDTTGGINTTSENKMSAFSFGIGAGVEKHFASAASKLDPYAGAMIDFSMLGPINSEVTNSAVDPDDATFGATTVTNNKFSGGIGFGVNLLAGFNYFFSDNFALGAEMSWGWSTASMGGKWEMEQSTDFNDPVATDTEMTTSTDAKVSTSGFGVGSTAGVNASIFF